MQAQTQLHSTKKLDILDIHVRLQKLDRAWYMNMEPEPSKNSIWKAFGNIECMLIQRYFLLYTASDFATKY